jgi:hypothetical protein
MKRIGFLLFAVMSFTTMSVWAQAPSVRRHHALLIAPGQYESSTGWAPTTGVSDLMMFRKSIARHGFDTARRVKVLQGAVATAAGMRSALTVLLKDVAPGDIVQIYFSGHGARLMDDDGDEADGYDEALAGWDAPAPGRSAQDITKTDRYVRDDEWWLYIDSLRKKLTASGIVNVFMDAGFDRSSCRTDVMVRGGAVPLASDGYHPAPSYSPHPEALFTEGAEAGQPETGRAPWMVVSAAGATGCTFEWREDRHPVTGALTAALIRCMDRLPSGVSGSDLFRQVCSIMHRMVPGQVPVAEGDGISRPFWGGLYKAVGPEAVVVRTEKDGSLLIDAGWATGWSDSSRVAIYRAGTKPGPGIRPLAVGLLTQSQSDVSKLVGARIPLEIPAAQLRAYLTEPAWLRSSISLGFVRTDRDPGGGEAADYFSAGEVQAIRDRLADLRFLNVTSKPEVWVRKSKRGYELLHGLTGKVLSAWAAAGEPADELPAVLKRYSLQRMLERVPVFSTTGSLVTVDVPMEEDRSGSEASGGLQVRVVNPFDVPMYMNLLEISPDAGIRTLLPLADGRSAVDETLTAPKSERSFTLSADHTGADPQRVLVWFMSPLPVDLRGLGDAVGYSSVDPQARGFGSFHLVDYSGPEDAVHVPESQGISGMLMIRVKSSGRMR